MDWKHTGQTMLPSLSTHPFDLCCVFYSQILVSNFRAIASMDQRQQEYVGALKAFCLRGQHIYSCLVVVPTKTIGEVCVVDPRNPVEGWYFARTSLHVRCYSLEESCAANC